MDKYKNLLVNFGLFGISSFATKFVTFLLVPLYTYYMSAGEYGVTDMSLTVIMLAMPLATLSFADAAVRFIVDDRSREGSYASVSFLVVLGSVAIVALLSPLLDLGAFGGLGAYKPEFVLAYAATALMQLCSEVSRGRGEVRLIAVLAGASSLVTLGLAFLLIGHMGMRVDGYFVSVSAGPFVAVAGYLTLGGLGGVVYSGLRNLSPSLLRETFLAMLGYSLPLIPNALFWWIGTSINRFFITGMLGIAASGMFAAASKIPSLVNTVYSIFQQAWQLSAFQEAKREGLDKFFSTVFMLLQALMLIMCSAMSLTAPLLASIFLQKGFYDAWPLVSVLLIANLLNVFNSFFGTVYTTEMKTGYIMRTTVFGALACVVATPLLIPEFGIYGAAMASCLGNGIVLLLRARNSRKLLEFDCGWAYALPCLVILVFQSVISVAQMPGWEIVSLVFLVVVFVTQFLRFTKWRQGRLKA